MADSIADIKDTYPIPVYHYRVSIDGNDALAFSEVSGLSIEYETTTYKDGMSFKMGAKHMPAQPTPPKITLKKGIVKAGSQLYDWLNSTNLNTVEKKDLTIDLLNEESQPVVTWQVLNAFPTKLEAPSLDATSNDVAVETLELMANDLKLIFS